MVSFSFRHVNCNIKFGKVILSSLLSFLQNLAHHHLLYYNGLLGNCINMTEGYSKRSWRSKPVCVAYKRISIIPGVFKIFCITKFVFKIKRNLFKDFRIFIAANVMALKFLYNVFFTQFWWKNYEWLICSTWFQELYFVQRKFDKEQFYFFISIFSPCLKFILPLPSKRDVPIPYSHTYLLNKPHIFQL